MAGALVASFARRFAGAAGIEADLRCDAGPDRVVVLFGPSGSGKTTVLRCLAGLDRPDRGFIRFDEQTWFDADAGVHLPPQARHLAYVSQDYGLFPHLTVEDNVAFGLTGSAAGRRARAAELVDRLRLRGLERRLPSQLSGGERQRVALARALARRPRLVLLDEPLAALDEPLRDGLRRELRQLLASIDVPSVIVSHDRLDALVLGDRLAVLAEGRIRQSGPVHEVFSRPADVAVAATVGVETVTPGRVVSAAGGLLIVRVGAATVAASGPERIGPDVFVCIRAENVILERAPARAMSARNQLAGRVLSVQPEGALVRVGLECGFALSALVSRPAFDDLRLAPGVEVTAVVKATAIHLIDRGSG